MVRTQRALPGFLPALVFVVAMATLASAQQVPRSVTIGTQAPGTVLHAAAGGIAKVVSGAAPFQMLIQPYTGATTYFPIINNGELDFGVASGIDLAMSYLGPARIKVGGRNPYPHAPNVRLVMRGSQLVVGLFVRKDSSIKSIHDLKGRRVTGEFPAQLNVYNLMVAHLASAGMTWDDVRIIPVTAAPEGADAVAQGRADVTSFTYNAAKVREVHAAVGIRFISNDCSPEGAERLRKVAPGFYPKWIKAGQGPGIVEDTCMTAFDAYLLTHRGASDPVVAPVLKAVWDNLDNLPPLHPFFKEWTRERAVDPDVTIPYHPAAVQFYKERGLWSARMEEAQRKLLALNP